MKIMLTVNWVERAKAPAPGGSVRHIGGKSGDMEWKHSEDQAIAFIERGTFDYFVKKNTRNLRVNVFSNTDGRKFLAVSDENSLPLADLDLPDHRQ
jgi:hypothetical protein